MNLPAQITFDLQPYGCVTLDSLTLGTYRNGVTVTGNVIAGTERAYLFGHVSVKPATGTRTIYSVTQAELDRGHIVRVAM